MTDRVRTSYWTDPEKQIMVHRGLSLVRPIRHVFRILHGQIYHYDFFKLGNGGGGHCSDGKFLPCVTMMMRKYATMKICILLQCWKGSIIANMQRRCIIDVGVRSTYRCGRHGCCNFFPIPGSSASIRYMAEDGKLLKSYHLITPWRTRCKSVLHSTISSISLLGKATLRAITR